MYRNASSCELMLDKSLVSADWSPWVYLSFAGGAVSPEIVASAIWSGDFVPEDEGLYIDTLTLDEPALMARMMSAIMDGQ